MRKHKSISLLIIFFIYVFAMFAGAGIFLISKPLGNIIAFLFADIMATVVVYLFAVILKNSSVYDPYWSVQPPVLFIAALCLAHSFTPTTIMLLVVLIVWSIRLTGNWIYTFDNLNWEDWRYKQYRSQNKMAFFQFINFTGIMLIPTLIVFCAMLPGLYLAQAHTAVVPTSGGLTVFGVLAAVCAIGAAALELIADTAMHRFRKNEQNRQSVCQIGVWKYSRHPNYLGEISFWWLIYLFVVLDTPGLWWTGFGALLNMLLFVFISIPLAEKRQMQKRPNYAEYKKTTHMLLLLPRRKFDKTNNKGTNQ